MFLGSISIGSMAIFFYYMSFAFGWDAYNEGVFLFVLSVSRMVWMLGGLPVLTRWVVGKRRVEGEGDVSGGGAGLEEKEKRTRFEVWVVRVGMGLMAAGYLGIALATKDWMIFAITFADGFGSIARPTVRGLLSRTVPKRMQGRLLSGLQLVEQIALVFASILFPTVWAKTVKTATPNAFLYLVAGCYAIACAVTMLVKSDGLVVDDHETGQSAAGDPSGEEEAAKVAGSVLEEAPPS